jgi:hypothetical protein
MKKQTDVHVRDREVASLKIRVADLERTSAALSARMLALFGPAAKPAEIFALGSVRPAIGPVVR